MLKLGCPEISLDHREKLALLEANVGDELFAELPNRSERGRFGECQCGGAEPKVLRRETRRSLRVNGAEQVPRGQQDLFLDSKMSRSFALPELEELRGC